ncbi:fumarate reductase subunit C [Chelonobacter oris]|uniref:Fumarate reductase subunit C n=1 Tax=Chelonobacter oris TaxID=505317 RepID=A0A0A3AKL9_9PAST|nr:fumarate reductase subunit FrdC [Chelonobacter oris]KGQ69876.1 fumarate reductase [Chelonobacter oris]MDH2999236.1 fumarate reductase subunit C [Chelonobacter oris]
MTTTTSKRNKYVREMKSNWWQKLDFYKMYILRESTALPTIWFCIVLLYGFLCLGNGTFETGFVSFLKNPLVIILSVITMAGVVFNTLTWFGLTPKALNLIYKSQRVPQSAIKSLMWVITIAVSVLTLVLVYI